MLLASKLNMYQLASFMVISPAANIPAPCPSQQATRAPGRYAKWFRRAAHAEPHLKKLHKYDARCASYLWRNIEVVITRRS